MEKKYDVLDTEVSKALAQFEKRTEMETGIRHISGGFASADITGHDDHNFFVRLKWGIQNDTENNVHTEEWHLNRTTLNFWEE